MRIILVFLLLVSVYIVFSNDCKSKFDLSIYMMPYDRSLYLEARNKIIHEERLTIDCDQNLQKQFEVKKHLSFLNSHIVFRAFIGNSETPLIRCKVLIRDSLCDVSSDEYILPPPSYIPLNNTE